MKTITSVTELEQARADHPGSVLLDVRLPEDYAAGHLPEAVNQCVYEVAFLPELEKRGLAKEACLLVYGAGGTSAESRTAAEKLERAGFTQVANFTGGMDAWTAAGRTTEGGAAALPAPVVRDGEHALDLAESRVVWVGRNLINKHWGSVAVESGQVTFQEGQAVSGEVVLDMRRILCSDLAAATFTMCSFTIWRVMTSSTWGVFPRHALPLTGRRSARTRPAAGTCACMGN